MNISDKNLQDLFSELGTINNFNVYTKPETTSRMAFLTYSTFEEAEYAIKSIEGYQIPGYPQTLHCFINLKEENYTKSKKHSTKPTRYIANFTYYDDDYVEDKSFSTPRSSEKTSKSSTVSLNPKPSMSKYDNNDYSYTPQGQTRYQQQVYDTNPDGSSNYTTSNTQNYVSQGTQQPSPLTPYDSNNFNFPTSQQPQQQPAYPENSAFESYLKGSTSNPLFSPPLQPPPVSHSTSKKMDQYSQQAYFDPLHGPELINRYRQELEDIDDRMKATTGRVISLEEINLELQTKVEYCESPLSFQRLLDLMEEKLTEFHNVKRQLYSTPYPSSLADIAKEVLSNRSRFSLSQMSEVVEMRSIQNQLAELVAQIRITPKEEGCPALDQLITQRNEYRFKLITCMSSLIETLSQLSFEERKEELNAVKERLKNIPCYIAEISKQIDLTVCLETFESVQSFDTKEFMIGQEEEAGLEELCTKLQVSFRFYNSLLSLDHNEDIGEEGGSNSSELIHKIIQTADGEIDALKLMQDVQLDRVNTASSSLTQAVAYELERELAEVESIETTLIPKLKSELKFLQIWEATPPSLEKLLRYRKERKKLRAELRHLRVDMKEIVEDSTAGNLSEMELNFKTHLSNFHQLLLAEHEEMLVISELYDLHYSELATLHPELGLEQQIEFGPVYMHFWEEDYFGDFEEVSFFSEPTNLTTFSEEKCLLREFKITSVEQQNSITNTVNKLIQIEHNSVLKCDAMFFNKSGTKAFLKHPVIEGTYILEYVRSETCQTSTQLLLLEILKGLIAIHSAGLYCSHLSKKGDIFVNNSLVLITSIELLSQTSEVELRAYQRNDLLQFCTLILSIFSCYENSFLNSKVGDWNIETVVKKSGLEERTLRFVLEILDESSTPSKLAEHSYFDNIPHTDPIVKESIIEVTPYVSGDEDEEVEKLMKPSLK